MKVSSIGVVLAGLALTAGSLLLSSTPAQAAGGCTVYVPTRIVIASPEKEWPLRYGSNCQTPEAYDAEWIAYGSGGRIEYDFTYPDDQALSIYESESDTGRWTWKPEEPIPSFAQNTAHSVVRLGSKAYLRVSRSGSTVTVWTRDSRYFANRHYPDPGRWNFYAGWHGQIQWRYVGYRTWHALKDTVQNSSGTYSYTYTQRYARQYRVVFPDNSVVWGSTSPTLQR